MIFISRKVDYAILLLTDLARREDGSSARELAARYHLSRPFVANILKQLCQAGFIEGHRGVNGGYRLGRPAKEISLDMVVTALDGPFQLMTCADEGDDACSLEKICPVRGPLRLVHHRIRDALIGVTIEDLRHDEIEPELVMLETSGS